MYQICIPHIKQKWKISLELKFKLFPNLYLIFNTWLIDVDFDVEQVVVVTLHGHVEEVPLIVVVVACTPITNGKLFNWLSIWVSEWSFIAFCGSPTTMLIMLTYFILWNWVKNGYELWNLVENCQDVRFACKTFK